MNLERKVAIGGRACFSVLDKNGNEKEFVNKDKTLRSGEFVENTILDSFFEHILTGITYLESCLKVGTGSGETDISQTTLSNPYAPATSWPVARASLRDTIDNNDGFIIYKDTYDFSFRVGDLIGNFSEVGILFGVRTYDGIGASGSYENSKDNYNVHTRLLIKDSSGNPTTITMLADEQLNISYVVYAKVPKGPAVQSTVISVDGVDQPIEVITMTTGEALMTSYFNKYLAFSTQASSRVFHSYSGDIGGEGERVPTSVADGDDVFEVGSENGYNYIDIEFNSESANYEGGITGVSQRTASGYYVAYKWAFNPPIMKTNKQRLKFRIKLTYSRA